MSNYHINEKGEAKLCQAQPGFCPLGNYDSHKSTQQEAEKSYEKFMKELPDPKKTVKFFFITRVESSCFTDADCTHFAKTLNKKMNLPIYYLGDEQSKDSAVADRRWSHFVNRLPDGRFIDAEGIWTEKDLIKRWQVDNLGSGWLPNSINPAENTEMRKMGMQSAMFPDHKPLTTINKIIKNIGQFINFSE